MKNLLLFSLFSMLMSLSYAQNVSFGLKAGLTSSDWRISSASMDEVYLSRSSMHAGAFVNLNISKRFSLQPEVIYNITGAKINNIDVTNRAAGSSDLLYDLQYVNVPIMTRFKFNNNIHLEFGPQLGILIKANANFEGENFDISDELEKMDLGIGAGAGYEFENGIFFNARYVYGMSNIVRDLGQDDWIKNNVLQFSTGYRFQ